MLNMKKSVISAIAAMVSFTASAQMLPDSTVQVCAYWNKGDKVTYKCTSKEAEIGYEGIENIKQTTSEKRIFEVTAQTDKSYDLSVSYKDTETSFATGAIGELLNNINEQFTVKLKTDEFGTVQEITNKKEVIATMSKVVPLAVKMIYDKLGEEALNQLGVSEEQMTDQLTHTFCNEQVAETACMKDIMPILMYHGARMGLNEKYSTKQQVPDSMGNGYIEADLSFWVDKEESDSAFVVLRSILTAGKDVFAPRAREAARNNVIATFPPESQAGAFARIDEMIGAMDFSMVKSTVTIVHLDSGWPTYYKSEGHMKVTDEKGTKDTVNIEEFTLDDCE